MKNRLALLLILPALSFGLISCASMAKKMPDRLVRMRAFLTQDNPGQCNKYHYNYERQAPRLYETGQKDSILDMIDYIKTECGPAGNLEVPRMLILADKGEFGDSLIGSSTIPQMLWYRSEREFLLNKMSMSYLYGYRQPQDNTHDRFNEFITDLAHRVSTESGASPEEQTIGQFYGGAFDSAFDRMQSPQVQDAALGKAYDNFVDRTKAMFPLRNDVSIVVGSWRPQGDNRLLGNHPVIGLQYGGEGKLWRANAIFSYRFLSAKNDYNVDSLGQIVSTKKFGSMLLGVDAGLKIFDNSLFSTDIFAGIGYDVIYSVSEEGDPEETVTHGSFAASIGLRQRLFIDQRKGLYLGGMLRYSLVDYSNPKGTDLSGNTVTVGMMVGWSFHQTLYQFLNKLDYKGSRRP